jgi:hypothetical protein
MTHLCAHVIWIALKRLISHSIASLLVRLNRGEDLHELQPWNLPGVQIQTRTLKAIIVIENNNMIAEILAKWNDRERKTSNVWKDRWSQKKTRRSVIAMRK